MHSTHYDRIHATRYCITAAAALATLAGLVPAAHADPTRMWGTYDGGSAFETARGVVLDEDNNVVTVGDIASTSGLAASSLHDSTHNGGHDAFFTKFDAGGSQVWGNYYGGSGDDTFHDVVYDEDAAVYYAAGGTRSANTVNDVIATPSTHQTFLDGEGDAMLVKFIGTGLRRWGTYFGGSGHEEAFATCLDSQGDVYIVGTTTSDDLFDGVLDFTPHDDTLDGTVDAFVAKFSGDTGLLLWGTYYGGSAGETLAYDCGVGSDDAVYVGGYSTSANNELDGAFFDTHGGGHDAFLVRYDTDGVLEWATYFGGSGDDQGRGVAVDTTGPDDLVYLAGVAGSTSGIASGPFALTSKSGVTDAFLAQFDVDGDIPVWSRYWGGSGFDQFEGIDAAGEVYLSGATTSSGLFSSGFDNTYAGSVWDGLFVNFEADGSEVWGSYNGGDGTDEAVLAVDQRFDTLVGVGGTNSSSNTGINAATAPATVHDATYDGNYDIFMTFIRLFTI